MHVLENKNIFTTTLLILGLALLASCDFSNDTASAGFKKNIRKFISSGESETPLTALTNFNWNNVCIFRPIGSAPDAGYVSYLEHVKSIEEHVIPIKKSSDYIFLFSLEDKQFQHIVLSAPLYLDSEKYWLDFSGEKQTDKCFSATATVTLKAGNILLIG